MLVSSVKKALWLSVSFILFVGFAVAAVSAQPVYSRPTNPRPSPTPFLQPIVIQPGQKAPTYPQPTPAPNYERQAKPSPTPLITRTSDVQPIYPENSVSNIGIPGYSGILVVDMNGKIIRENFSNFAFNPASNVKTLTTYAVLKTLGPNFRFLTNVWTDGEVDKTTGTLNGNLYVSGRSPMFVYEHAMEMADALNKNGIRMVNGDLIVTDRFSMNYSESTKLSADTLYNTLNMEKRHPAATRAWQTYLASSGKFSQFQSIPSVAFTGRVYIEAMPNSAKLVFSHESIPLREIIKIMMSYSHNVMADRLGDYIGGPYAVAQVCAQNSGSLPQEIILASSSGLGVNRVTPKAMMNVLRTLYKYLEANKMNFGDVMPIAGMDEGTLKNRFTGGSRGSVVGKTGTLGNTDGGVSALSGIMNSTKGKLFFVIFNQRGSVPRFRSFQDAFVSQLQNEYGGAVSLGYVSTSFAVRMSATRISYPASRPRN